MASLYLLVVVACLVLCASTSSYAARLNERPIIGILSQPVSATDNRAFIIASYVKWIEGAGARVVPIFYNSTTAELTKIFSSINGLIMPGGEQPLNPGHVFYSTSISLYGMARDANGRGDYFPVWGTCQGFQFLNIAASTLKNESVLGTFNSWDYSWPLDFTPEAKTSRIYGSAPSNIVLLHLPCFD
eukprot:TRINITY_DN34307_c0_g1_i2.p1 TRINITY_DN34307_c0_g1~~TRINITY_DN34307_c0_g1_i2.p1  ORF type:complete len:194 (+),score=23.11 TRINITY_DN34307_c0_g1_i2:22-582(+)